MDETQGGFEQRLSELRIRAGHNAALTLDGRNILLPTACTAAEVSESLAALCNGSLYAHSESLRRGFLSAFGYRVGVGGRAVTEEGVITGIADPTSLCIRIPHRIEGAGAVAHRLFRDLGCRAGILVYSPPGVGKTTLLRDLACSLSLGEGARRVALVDARGELYDPDAPPACQIDVLRGYPLAEGIEIATRTLAPEVILCDEIGSFEEAEAVLSVIGAGVPIVASAHASSVGELLARAPIRLLAESGVFAAYLGVLRSVSGYTYSIDYATRVS